MKTFNFSEELQQHYDDVIDLEMGNLIEVSRLMVGSISILSEPTPDVFESIETLSNLDAKEKIAQEVLKVKLTLNP